MSAISISTGRVVTTLGVNTDMTRWGSDLIGFVNVSLQRHTAGDWGELTDPGDAAANDHAALLGNRILSAYTLPPKLAAKTGEPTLWIITEADRASTTLLWPGEY